MVESACLIAPARAVNSLEVSLPELPSGRSRRRPSGALRSRSMGTTEDGSVLERRGKVALCRCGGIGNQPFCDGSHQRVGFRSAR